MRYKLRIEWGDEQVIEIGANNDEEKIITDVDVWMHTLNDNATKKTNAMLARVTVKGTIDASKDSLKKNLSQKLRDIFEWSKDFNSGTTYRTIRLEMYENEFTFRKYKLDRVFLHDYKEQYGEGDQVGTFMLEITQQDNELDTIEAV